MLSFQFNPVYTADEFQIPFTGVLETVYHAAGNERIAAFGHFILVTFDRAFTLPLYDKYLVLVGMIVQTDGSALLYNDVTHEEKLSAVLIG